MMRRYFLLTLLFAHFTLFADVPYRVEVEGLEEGKMLDTLKSISQLYSLLDHPPPTKTALRRRADGDVSNFLMGFQSLGHYSPFIRVEVDSQTVPALVTLNLDPGPLYTLSSVSVFEAEEDPKDFNYEEINPICLGLTLGTPIFPRRIINAEIALEQLLTTSGYPLAKVTNREVIADGETQTISIEFEVNSGPIAYFGPVEIIGNRSVANIFLEKKITWCQGELYDFNKIKETKNVLEGSGLFSAVTINTPKELFEDGSLPIEISVIEGKHHTLAFGASYNTQLGGGLISEWQHRNVRNIGEVITFKGDLWFEKQRGTLVYRQPDFICQNQDLLWLIEGEREKASGFEEKFGSLSALIIRTWGLNSKLSYGVSFKQLESEDAATSGSYSLVKLPIKIRWSSANNLLDPTCGASLQVKFTPTFSMLDPQFTYFINTNTATYYVPIHGDELIFAGKGMIGTIFGASSRTIPTPELFFAGSENTLRGYRYKTVSPLSPARKPLGGRSLVAGSAELRYRMSDSIGWVLFYDVGNVFSSIAPQINRNYLQSTGIGLRYHTPVGPLRVDVAFPLSGRPGIDRQYELYFSIGQAF